jgi:DNA-binding response OmpR family regulator
VLGELLVLGGAAIENEVARTVDTQFVPAGSRLDEGARALKLGNATVPLTRLEFGLLRYLQNHPDRVVTRDELLRDVWGQSFGGSNVVDAVVRTLRKKLGAQGRAVETVIGHGYRFCGFAQA